MARADMIQTSKVLGIMIENPLEIVNRPSLFTAMDLT